MAQVYNELLDIVLFEGSFDECLCYMAEQSINSEYECDHISIIEEEN